MYCIITTCSVECYWHCSEETVHYKSDEMVNFCGFRCATTSPITVFINFVFYIYLYIKPRTFDQAKKICLCNPRVCVKRVRVNEVLLYDGAWSVRHRKTRRASLNSTRYRTGNQWSCCKVGVMWSQCRTPVTSRAAAFWTDCRWRISPSATPYSRELQ